MSNIIHADLGLFQEFVVVLSLIKTFTKYVDIIALTKDLGREWVGPLGLAK